jgi:hypothetical protein
MQQPLEQPVLEGFPEQLRGIVSSLYDAGRICYNDLVVLSAAFISEPIPRYNTQATAIAAVLGQMDIFNWAIAADYRYSSYDYKQASDARDHDLQVMIERQKYRAEAPIAQYPSTYMANMQEPPAKTHKKTKTYHGSYDNISADKYRASRQYPYDKYPLENLPKMKGEWEHGKSTTPKKAIPPYYDVYTHSNEFYGIEDDAGFFDDISAETSTDEASYESSDAGPLLESQKTYGSLSCDDIVELAGRYKLSHPA